MAKETKLALIDAMHEYAAEAVRMALEKAKNRADVMLLNKYGCHEGDFNLFDSILSLEAEIISKLK